MITKINTFYKKYLPPPKKKLTIIKTEMEATYRWTVIIDGRLSQR